MDTVTDRVLADYQSYFEQLHLQLELFQKQHNQQLTQLELQAEGAELESYMALLGEFRKNIKNSRLIAIINSDGEGVLRHITGDFLPDCQAEIEATLKAGMQEQLFLHRSENSVHFDLLLPLDNSRSSFLFAAFNPDVLQQLLVQYQLPHQQLYLLRTDNVGKIELSSEANVTNKQAIVMSENDLQSFSFVKSIPNTRWQLAIRLDDEYNQKIIYETAFKSLLLWILFTAVVYAFYRVQKLRSEKYLTIKQEASFHQKHDNLTELVNRAHFENELNAFISVDVHKNLPTQGVIFQIDLDQFQVINSIHGYAFGDSLLAAFSAELKSFLPESAIVSRLGNDEFAVLMADLPHTDGVSYAQKLREFILSLRLIPDAPSEHISACIGVVILDDELTEVEQVIKSLSQSVAIAKAKGRNRVQLYQSDDPTLLKHAAEMKVTQNIEYALKTNQFVLFRQHIYSLQAKPDDVEYVEVLVRMRGTDGDYIPPAFFINAAEKYDLIYRIDIWVIEATCKALVDDKSFSGNVSVNLSGKTLANVNLANDVKYLFAKYHIDPTRFGFEVTETAAISHLQTALAFFKEMKELGCTFSLDDFGSGLSSFAYLQQLPVDIIKIDGSFIHNLDSDSMSSVLVENIQRIANAMGKKTVAEWVENDLVEQCLKSLQVDYVQGYLRHKPEQWYPHD